MPRDQHKRGAAGTGGIHKKTVIRNGKTYTYWEARITTGYDPGTGKQIQRFITGKTQKEVREKLQVIAVELNEGTYQTPTKQTVSEWLDVWASEYLESVKPRTKDSYICNIKRYIKPAFGDSNEESHNLSAQTVYLHFKKIAAAIGHPDTRLHDLRHTYAVVSIQNGDNIKTVQENLGHHTAAFTLDTYGHVTNQIQQASAAHMEAFIQSVSST